MGKSQKMEDGVVLINNIALLPATLYQIETSYSFFSIFWRNTPPPRASQERKRPD